VPSYVSDVTISETPSTEAPTTASGTASPARRRFSTRVAAVALAGAAAVSLGACTTGGGSSSAVRVAAAQAGEPYVYGAAGPNAFDCSGFVQYVYGQTGKSIPRTSSAQQAAATPVSRSAARPGDIVFIGSPAYHVGIYAGNGMMWTAPKSGDVVKLQRIWSSSYTLGRF
jgi:cell wall-associated NlpC family hydrolase